MRLLFDNGVPSPLADFLGHHEVTFARDRGWAEYVNGRLIAAAEAEGFDTIVTCDKNWSYQQNLTSRRIAFAVLPTNIWPHLQPHIAEIVTFIETLGAMQYGELLLPRPRLKRNLPPTLD